MKKFVSIILVLFFLPVLISAQKVIAIKVDGTINPASAAYIKSGIERAEKDGAECLLIELNTPGGLLRSTREIVGAIMEAGVPVIVYVAPGGAQAGSAGVFITMAAHISAMAPGTNIGAAHPVSGQGQMDSIMNGKVTNDAAAFIRTIALKRNKNARWAEDAVRNSVSITEKEALDSNVIDIIAASDIQLLKKLNGSVMVAGNGTSILNTANPAVTMVEMSLITKLLNIISDPNVAYILLMLGFYGLLFELYSPGAILPGVIGGISLILALYSLNTLPLNYTGLALIVFAIILFILEIKVTSYGILGIGGVVSLVIGSMILIPLNPLTIFFQISRGLIIAIALITALLFFIVIGMATRVQKSTPVSGVEGMIGKTGETLGVLDPKGRVRVHGEEWNAIATSPHIADAQKVKIVRIENLTLFVEII